MAGMDFGYCERVYPKRPKNFKRVEKFTYHKNVFKLYIDKNDSIYDIMVCGVLSWKFIEKGKKKIRVPDKTVETRDLVLFNKIKGNPTKIAINKIMAEVDIVELVS